MFAGIDKTLCTSWMISCLLMFIDVVYWCLFVNGTNKTSIWSCLSSCWSHSHVCSVPTAETSLKNPTACWTPHTHFLHSQSRKTTSNTHQTNPWVDLMSIDWFVRKILPPESLMIFLSEHQGGFRWRFSRLYRKIHWWNDPWKWITLITRK